MNLIDVTPKKEKITNSGTPIVKISPVKVPEGAKQIGNYVLGKTIGSGTFGKVHLGLHIPTGERVAVKIIDKLKLGQKDRERVHREMQILKKIMHPSLIHLYEIIETQKSLLFIMEYVQNGELFNHIIKNQKLPEDEACKIFHQIIDGVQYLHSVGVTHRDLKPENILMDYDGKVKIIDFGLSNTYLANEKLKTQCGSPCYAAPEMIEGKHRYEPLAVDIWSTGIVLFAMISGYLPFCDPDTSKLYKKILSGAFKFPAWVSQNAKDLISKILVVNPAKRVTIADIRQHPWYQAAEMKRATGIDTKFYKVPYQASMITHIQNLGLKLPQLAESIQANVKTKQTALYYIIMKKLVREGSQFQSFFASQNFDHSLLVPWQTIDDQGVESTFVETESVSAVPVQAELSSPEASTSLQFYNVKSITFMAILKDFLNYPIGTDEKDIKTEILKDKFYANNLQNKKKRPNLKLQKPQRLKTLFNLEKKEKSKAKLHLNESPKKLLLPVLTKDNITLKTHTSRPIKTALKVKSDENYRKFGNRKLTPLEIIIRRKKTSSATMNISHA